MRNGSIPADVLQIMNEPHLSGGESTDAARRLADWYIAQMQAATAKGVKITVGDFGVGHVEAWHVFEIKRMLAHAEAHGHVFQYHMYNVDPGQDNGRPSTDMDTAKEFYSMRWAPWVEDFPQLDIVMGEAGPYDGHFYSVETTIKMMHQAQQQVAAYGRVKAVNWWTFVAQNDARWGRDDCTAVLPEYERVRRG